MFDLIIEYLSWILLLLLSIFLYVFLTGRLYPTLFLKPRYDVSALTDRGIARYQFDGGRAITYAPSIRIRKYIKSYVLSSIDGEKYMQCELDDRIDFIHYDVVIYDSNDRAVRVVSVKDPIATHGKTRMTLLPSETAYVNVILRSVNGEEISNEAVALIPKRKIMLYVLLTALTSAAEALLLQKKVLDLADEMFSYAPLTMDDVLLPTAISAAVIGAVCAAITALVRAVKNKNGSK